MKALAGRIATAAARSGWLRAVESIDRSPARLRILAYHRVDEPDARPHLEPGLLSATPDEFRRHVEIATRHYSPISLATLLAAQRGETELPPRPLLFTFDDGYADFAEHAWPILCAAEVPAVLFVSTDFPDSSGRGFWWDRLHAALSTTVRASIELDDGSSLALDSPAARRAAYRRLRLRLKASPHAEAMARVEETIDRLGEPDVSAPVLGWDALRKLVGEGLEVGSHGCCHALCTRLEEDVLRGELAASRERLSRELGADAARVFAYPASACDSTSRRVVRESGFALGFGGIRGVESWPPRDPAELRRLPVIRYGADLFRAQLRPSVAALGRSWTELKNRSAERKT